MTIFPPHDNPRRLFPDMKALQLPALFLLTLAAGLWVERAPAFPYDLPLATNPHLADLAQPPDWSQLDPWQKTLTHDTFHALLTEVFTDGSDAWKEWIDLHDDHADIVMHAARPLERYVLRFAKDEQSIHPGPAPGRRSARYWRHPSEMPPLSEEQRRDTPLQGVRIAIDPGHIGGDFAEMEWRSFQVGNEPPIREGDIVLEVAKRLESQLEELGARVTLVRSTNEPVTSSRPAHLTSYAISTFNLQGLETPPLGRLYSTRNRLFYVNAEIRSRAHLINRRIRPDITLCLHLNAEPWGDPANPSLVDRDHLHILINGCYGPSEIANDDQRFEMLHRLLSGLHVIERDAGDVVARQMAEDTGLEPFIYKGPNARQVNDNDYLWARNLLANRLFSNPVLFLEPYVMNNKETYARLQAGAYEGERTFGGVKRINIYDEYANSVTTAIADYYRNERLPVQ